MSEPEHIKTSVDSIMSGLKRKKQRTERMLWYLDDLRESGVTNMYGARPYLEREFKISKEEARDILSLWMRTFSERHPK